MQVCASLQTDNHASTPLLSFFTGRMPFLPPNQRCQSTEGKFNSDSTNTKQFDSVWFSARNNFVQYDLIQFAAAE